MDCDKIAKELTENEKKYRSIFENLVDLYYQTNPQGIITEVSPSCYAMSGWRAEELIGRQVLDVYPNPEDRKGLLDRILQDGKVNDYEVVLKTKDGTHVPVSVSSRVIKDAQGNLQYIEGIVRDISKRKKIEEALNQNIKEVERLNKLLTSRDSTISELTKEIEELRSRS